MPVECPVDGYEMERVALYADGEAHYVCPTCRYRKIEWPRRVTA